SRRSSRSPQCLEPAPCRSDERTVRMPCHELLEGAPLPARLGTSTVHLREAKLGLRRELTASCFGLSIQLLGSCDVPELFQTHLSRRDACDRRWHAVRI